MNKNRAIDPTQIFTNMLLNANVQKEIERKKVHHSPKPKTSGLIATQKKQAASKDVPAEQEMAEPQCEAVAGFSLWKRYAWIIFGIFTCGFGFWFYKQGSDAFIDGFIDGFVGHNLYSR